MTNTTVPNLPAVTSLNGTEELNVVQSGTSTRATVAQVGTYVNSAYPAPGVSSVATSSPITGGTITSTGTIGLQSAGVTNAYLATMPAGTVKANVTGGTAAPTDATPSAVLDILGTTQGMTLYRGASSWAALPGSGTNTLLSLSGSTSNPAWQTLSYMIDNAIGSASAQGTVLYRGASSWSALAPGTAGQLLRTNGASANPSWYTVTGAGTVTSVDASGGTTGMTFTGGPITVSGTLTLSGTLIGTNGGTGVNNGTKTITLGGNLTTSGAFNTTFTTTATTALTLPISGYVISSVTQLAANPVTGTPSSTTYLRGDGTWAAISTSSGTVTSVDVSGGTTGLTTSGGPVTSSGTITLAGTLVAVNGGTGQSSYAVGDLLYASTTTALSKLPDVATGNALISGGVGVAPSWNKIGLTTHVSGTLPTANGGTNLTAFTSGGAVYATSTSVLTTGTLPIGSGGTNTTATATANGVTYGTGTAYAFTAAGTTGQVLLATTSSAPSWGQVSLTAGVTGTLPIANGGTNSTDTATAGGIGYGTGTAHAYTAAGTAGQVLTSNGVSAPTWAAAAATGVTSVASTFTGGIVSVSGTPITSTGTLAYTVAGTSGGIPYFSSGTTWATSAALTQYGVVYGGGAGAAPASTAAGTAGYALIANSAAAPTFQQVSLTAGVTGTLPVANGGTGSTTLTANNVLLGNGTSALQVVAPGTNGNILTSNGTTWVSSTPAATGPTKAQTIAYAMVFGF